MPLKISQAKSSTCSSPVKFPSFFSSVFVLDPSGGLPVLAAPSFSPLSLLELATTYGNAWCSLCELLLPFLVGPLSGSLVEPWGITIFKGGTFKSLFPSSTSASLVLSGLGLATGLFFSVAPVREITLLTIKTLFPYPS